jgi:hypothetical protein
MRRFAAVASAGAALAGLVMFAQPAAAAYAPTKVTIVVKPTGGPRHSVTLTCDPVGGTHRNAATACAVLAAAQGNPAAIEPADVMCTLEYSPVRVKMTGRYHRKPVRFTRTYSNPCRLGAEAGALFAI